jgi:UDP-N-acetylmuramoyl-L-alanyl-D-glutamate--2,6-diaminopimelate ligase
MTVKQQVVKKLRSVLPPATVRGLEEGYRRGRTKLVRIRYGNPSRGMKIIGVTGTNGKTTTINFINEILKEAGLKTAMFSTALIEINGRTERNELNATVPNMKRLMQFFRDARKAKVDFVLLEVSSHALHQHKLDGIKFTAAVMTNLTQDHLDYHHTMEEYAAVKGKLFDGRPRYIVLNRDDEWFDFFDKYTSSSHKITYGTHPEAEARIERVKLYKKGSEARVVIDSQTKLELATALPGKYNVYNMTAAVSLAYLLEIDLNHIIEGVANLEGVPGRYERVAEGLGYDVIVDYAHTPDGLEKLLEAAKSVTKGRIILVFGCTGDRDKAKRPIMGEIATRLTDRIILTDEENYTEDAKAIRDQIFEGITSAGGTAKTKEIADRREAIKNALTIARKGDTILITGLGHERYRITDGKAVPWNDGEVVRELIAELRSKKV